VGLSTPEGSWARLFVFSGDRSENKAASAQEALQLLFDYLQGERQLDGDRR